MCQAEIGCQRRKATHLNLYYLQTHMIVFKFLEYFNYDWSSVYLAFLLLSSKSDDGIIFYDRFELISQHLLIIWLKTLCLNLASHTFTRKEWPSDRPFFFSFVTNCHRRRQVSQIQRNWIISHKICPKIRRWQQHRFSSFTWHSCTGRLLPYL